jgi:hypothetical protein
VRFGPSKTGCNPNRSMECVQMSLENRVAKIEEWIKAHDKEIAECEARWAEIKKQVMVLAPTPTCVGGTPPQTLASDESQESADHHQPESAEASR